MQFIHFLQFDAISIPQASDPPDNKTKGQKLHRHQHFVSSTKIVLFHELQINLGITIRSILISILSIDLSPFAQSIYHHSINKQRQIEVDRQLSITICSIHQLIYHHSLHLSIHLSPFAPSIYPSVTIRSIYLSICHHSLHLSIHLSPFAPSRDKERERDKEIER